ncbi:hypothetical protein FB45DRAFT_111279 [Roridomyces roridus]|uniref:Uncharacterized protein n=1 Tax=Roridomyces roridus TaxID=1738132 RepID=A0AAD7BKB4_9AGAR|nr:hypothetical protein FB45DRAFT_111279 [Roridomyces roridus]
MSIKTSAPVAPVQVLLPITTPPRRHRSNSAILAWAARVQPGSPSSPRRSPSISHGPAPPGSASFITLIDTPSTAGKQFDLTTLGYSSFFIAAAASPKSACVAQIPIPPVPASPTKPSRVLKHFRSLSALTRSRAKSVSAVPPVPPMPPTTPKLFANKAKTYAKHTAPRPAPLANELALMQFADGGSLESHAKRVLAHQAKAAGPGVGVGTVFRDANGGIWWDAEEEWEFAHLLDGEHDVGSDDWVQFSGKENGGEERRGSVSTQDSDLDARFLVQPADDDALIAAFPPHRRGATTILALPARRRPAPHLRKPAQLDAFAAAPAVAAEPTPNSKGSARRRPAPPPLKLARPHPHARNDFFAASFAPSPLPVSGPVSPLALSPVSPGLHAHGHPRPRTSLPCATCGHCSAGAPIDLLFMNPKLL